MEAEIFPNLKKQKKFIIENSSILNKDIKITIFSIVMMETDINKDIISENIGNQGININLDAIELIKPEIITHIYNIVKNRLDILSKPLKL
jgi:hypothetical protein